MTDITLIDPLDALQAAIFETLSNDEELKALGVQIFDHVDGDHFPRIVIGEDKEEPQDTDCGSISEIFSTNRVYSRAIGKPEAKAIAGRVRFLLDIRYGFQVPGFHLSIGVCERNTIETHTDEQTTQAIIEFKFRAQALPLDLP